MKRSQLSLIGRALIIACLSAASFSSWSATQAVTLKLNFIEKIKSAETMGDELYFHVTEYSSMTKPVHTLVPDYPIHWLSHYLENVKNVTIWERSLKEGEAVELALSLTERDAPPWNLDDLVGTLKVKFKQEGGTLVQHWSSMSPQAIAQPKAAKQEPNEQRFLVGDGSYRLGFTLSSHRDN